jgi:hypothetical protein
MTRTSLALRRGASDLDLAGTAYLYMTACGQWSRGGAFRITPQIASQPLRRMNVTIS